jgi:hypothetical protein
MLKTGPAVIIRQDLVQVMNEVALKDDEYIVERAGKPIVAIIPVGCAMRERPILSSPAIII